MALASTALGEALRLRRGEPLAEFAYAGFADAERAHLAELTLVAIETRAEADLALGRHGELVGELEALCREHPLRERLWELLMLALYRAGRQAEALGAYTEARDRLVGELGIDPGPALRELEARILPAGRARLVHRKSRRRCGAVAGVGNGLAMVHQQQLCRRGHAGLVTRSARKGRAVLNWPRPPRSGTAIACAWRSAQRLVFSNVKRRRPRCRPATIGFVERRLWSRNPGHHPTSLHRGLLRGRMGQAGDHQPVHILGLRHRPGRALHRGLRRLPPRFQGARPGGDLPRGSLPARRGVPCPERRLDRPALGVIAAQLAIAKRGRKTRSRGVAPTACHPPRWAPSRPLTGEAPASPSITAT